MSKKIVILNGSPRKGIHPLWLRSLPEEQKKPDIQLRSFSLTVWISMAAKAALAATAAGNVHVCRRMI